MPRCSSPASCSSSPHPCRRRGPDRVIRALAAQRGATRRNAQASILKPIGARSSIVEGVAGVGVMQISRPRDLGPLILVVGLFVILLVVTLTIGAPQR